MAKKCWWCCFVFVVREIRCRSSLYKRFVVALQSPGGVILVLSCSSRKNTHILSWASFFGFAHGIAVWSLGDASEGKFRLPEQVLGDGHFGEFAVQTAHPPNKTDHHSNHIGMILSWQEDTPPPCVLLHVRDLYVINQDSRFSTNSFTFKVESSEQY
jgi:hypothetical protein